MSRFFERLAWSLLMLGSIVALLIIVIYGGYELVRGVHNLVRILFG